MDYFNNGVDPIKTVKERIKVIKRVNRTDLVNCRKCIAFYVIPERLDLWTFIKTCVDM